MMFITYVYIGDNYHIINKLLYFSGLGNTVTNRDNARRTVTTPMDSDDRQRILDALVVRYGFLVGGEDLRHALGYRSSAAIRQARARKTLPVAVFRVAGRRGHYARATDIADWLSALGAATQRKETERM